MIKELIKKGIGVFAKSYASDIKDALRYYVEHDSNPIRSGEVMVLIKLLDTLDIDQIIDDALS